VILACCAGVGMSGNLGNGGGIALASVSAGAVSDSVVSGSLTSSVNTPITELSPQRQAWEARYGGGRKWKEFKLPHMIGAFIDGGANFLKQIGIPAKMAVGIIAVRAYSGM